MLPILQNRRSSGLQIFHVNIRSLNKKFEKLQDFLSQLKGEFIVIALTETGSTDDEASKWFLAANSQLNPSSPKKSKWPQRDRIAIFIRDKLDFKILKNLKNNGIANLSIKTLQNHSKSILVSVIYRQPRGN